eukprot:gnl/TRDRNA2_/TRDRNA2_44582_c0_seq1.p1 gnl/TRDRNA2_/TRDRNA2_44582_c0~~gnl/TRDRNA2_/TRDRNA2_44582_c0_seq1.p1  ORF type:complete len:1085 (+),score=165.27 gnl/TRDRNA2_/TRDRNA2_44582_c0_seq1:102-3356(+)
MVSVMAAPASRKGFHFVPTMVDPMLVSAWPTVEDRLRPDVDDDPRWSRHPGVDLSMWKGGMDMREAVEYDIMPGMLKNVEELGFTAVDCLSHRGYCMINMGLDSDVLGDVLTEVQAIDDSRRFEPPPAEVAAALLGADGSARIAHLDFPGKGQEVQHGPILKQLDKAMQKICKALLPVLPSLGFHLHGRTPAILHESGESFGVSAPELTEQTASFWVGTLERHRVMCVLFLGPEGGVLELEPFYHPDAATVHVNVEPGTMILLRADALSHNLYAEDGRAVALSCWFQQDPPSEYGSKILSPAIEAIKAWMSNRMRDMKSEEHAKLMEGHVYEPDLPTDWVRGMNRTYHTQQRVGCQSVAGIYPNTEDMDIFWSSLLGGTDYATQIPLSRWDHNGMYDPEPTSWQISKTYVNHACFCDGMELLDNKMFMLSPAETNGMDPAHRKILEVSYQALHSAGLRKSNLMNTRAGVIIGAGVGEWAYVPHEASSTAGAACLQANRISYILGIKGASIVCDTRDAASLTAVQMGWHQATPVPGIDYVPRCLVGGVRLVMAPQPFVYDCAGGLMSHTGRCHAFDGAGSGYIRGDGVGAAVLQAHTELKGDELVVNATEPLAIVCGVASVQDGTHSNITAPYGPSQQEVVLDALRSARVQAVDVDFVEVGAWGNPLRDTVEALSMAGVLRGSDSSSDDHPLPLSAVRNSVGHAIDSSGICSFIKAVISQCWATQLPTQHIRALNPYIRAEQPVSLVVEASRLGPRNERSSFVGTSNSGLGGTNVHVLTFGTVKEDYLPPASTLKREVFHFWPGGGDVVEDMRIQDSYMIVGSWSAWKVTHYMYEEGNGVYGFTMTLGENGFEEFQIQLDGDEDSVLHPGRPCASKRTAAYGPEADVDKHWANTWLIDARPRFYHSAERDEQGELTVVEAPHEDVGEPGDCYRIRLRISGKWTSVDWEKLPRSPDLQAPTFTYGKYFIACGWEMWTLREMHMDPSRPGYFSIELTLDEVEDFDRPIFLPEFQIVRNKDWTQVFHPDSFQAVGMLRYPVLGPDAEGRHLCWRLDNGKPGDTFKIEFSREWASGEDRRGISWERLAK